MKKILVILVILLGLGAMTGCKEQPKLEGVALNKTYPSFVKALQKKGFRVVEVGDTFCHIEGTFKTYGDCLYVVNSDLRGEKVTKITMMLGHPTPDIKQAEAGFKLMESEMVNLLEKPAEELTIDNYIKCSMVKNEEKKMEANIDIEYFDVKEKTYVVMCVLYCD